MPAKVNPKALQRTNSQKRGLTKSPTESQTSPEAENKQKAVKMAVADKGDIQDLKKLIAANTCKMDEEFAKLNNSVLLLGNEIATLKKDINHIEARVSVIEKSMETDKDDKTKMAAEINAINQMKLETQLSILNIPHKLEAKQALECMSKWSKLELNDKSIRRAAIVNPPEQSTAILQLDFYELSTKHKLMRHIKVNQRDANKKYIPILTEQVFDIASSSPARGIELNFREPFTEQNRNIFNLARKHKDIFINVWLSRGYIMVKQENGKPIKLNSIDQLKAIINSVKNPEAMQT
jgi:hypothetical protein